MPLPDLSAAACRRRRDRYKQHLAGRLTEWEYLLDGMSPALRGAVAMQMSEKWIRQVSLRLRLPRLRCARCTARRRSCRGCVTARLQGPASWRRAA